MVLMVAQSGRRKKGLFCTLGFLFCFYFVFGNFLVTVAKADGLPSGIVEKALDGQTLALKDGRTLRLESIQAPAMNPANPAFQAWPLAEEAREKLATIAGQFDLTINPVIDPLDRYGRLIAQVIRPDGLWLQGEMVKSGLARVETTEANHSRADELLLIEAEARAARRGIWDLAFYAVRDHTDLANLVGTFQLVEGRILDVTRIRGHVYMNFGQNWRRDFTIDIAPHDRRAMEKQGVDFFKLKGQQVRIRGWLQYKNGPMITMDHRAQLEVLTP